MKRSWRGRSRVSVRGFSISFFPSISFSLPIQLHIDLWSFCFCLCVSDFSSRLSTLFSSNAVSLLTARELLSSTRPLHGRFKIKTQQKSGNNKYHVPIVVVLHLSAPSMTWRIESVSIFVTNWEEIRSVAATIGVAFTGEIIVGIPEKLRQVISYTYDRNRKFEHLVFLLLRFQPYLRSASRGSRKSYFGIIFCAGIFILA